MSPALPDSESIMDSPPTPTKCPHCKKIFSGEKTMVKHMADEYRASGWRAHLHCRICKKPFKTPEALDYHSKTNHAQDQKLDCPACDRHFVRATDLVRHIEQNRCTGIDTAKLAEVREQKLWFARELQARHFGEYDEGAEAALMSRNSALRPKPEATVRPYPVQFEVYESDTVDVYSYYQNVIQSSRAINSSNAKQPSPQQLEQAGLETTQPINIEKWQQDVPSQDEAGLSLLDDFVPNEHDNLQQSLIDYLDSDGKNDPGQNDPWSVYFNPWGNDDLIGLSTREHSPDSYLASTVRAMSPAAAPAQRSFDSTPTKTSRAITPTTDWPALTPTKNPGDPATPTHKSYAAMALGTSLALTPTRASGSAPKPIQESPPAWPFQTSQALTPTKGPGVLTPSQGNNDPAVADFDSVKKSFASFAALHNPSNPTFKAEAYWEPLILKYKCPMPQCFKSFKKKGQFVNHMKTHMQDKKCFYPCPGCKNMFETLAGLIAHTESQSTRCHFRHSRNYGVFISQALAGIVDVVGEDMEHSTVKFAVSKEAMRIFGAGGGGGSDGDGTADDMVDEARVGRPVAFKEATAAMEERMADELEAKKRFWEEHERMIEQQKAREAEEEHAREAEERQAREEEWKLELAGGETMANDGAEEAQIKRLEQEERQFREALAKIENERRKIQEDKQRRAVETARKANQDMQERKASEQPKEKTYTVTDPAKFDWW